ncbi:uncharacterized protein LOC120245310 isoform X2 [Hyaena hyaena]|uniref:uncharacterized protein LOC120245310 isoform X2 n=1 Tax=Hyaena hyaena TaxID=95912 RepID=UPI0019221F3A|nr:uncharacterized protein LOC120245310 isoform X2 [Hyaena hyaena]
MGEAKPVQTGGASNLARPPSRAASAPFSLFPWKRTPVPPSPGCRLYSSSHPWRNFTKSVSSHRHTSSPYAPIRAPSVRLAPSPNAQIPRTQLTRLLLACIGPGRRLFCLLLFQRFNSDPKTKTLSHPDWLSGGWKQPVTNQQLPARPAASRSRFRPDLGDKQESWGGPGAVVGCLWSAALNWSNSPAGNPPGHYPQRLSRALLRSSDPGFCPPVDAPVDCMPASLAHAAGLLALGSSPAGYTVPSFPSVLGTTSRCSGSVVLHPGAVCTSRIPGPLSRRGVPLPCAPDTDPSLGCHLPDP